VADDPAAYLLTNAEPETVARFGGLEVVFDSVTCGHLTRLGLKQGLSCLEVGAGSGSIARWMADAVGPTGRVLAVDLDPRWCRDDGRAQLEVRAVDLVTQPVPEGPWDVIHERLMLQHLPERLDVLTRLVDALAPGGLLLLEDFDTRELRTIDRDGPDHALIVRMAQAFNQVLGTRGGVSDFAANALRTVRGLGLEDTGASGYVAVDFGGTGWAAVQAANAQQVKLDLISQGITLDEVDRFVEVMADPDSIVGSSVLISTWGRHPERAPR
jgi:SAM-dependent methyltransferase